ncbi:hypothetical protein WJX74_010320 [Apatococcus lobatus]|uniref:Uncharacterized protein n=1 Tax=Apatococcus lobatus TaxID=904363 RepID=A0AAW1RLA5_9CHLO
MQALLCSQVAFICKVRLGASASVRPLKLKRHESAWEARWAPENPCRSLLLECEDEDMECRLLLLDPSSPGIRARQPTSQWIDQQHKWSIHCFLPAGALLFSRHFGIGFAVLNMDSLDMTATWSSEYQSNKFQASMQERYICVEQSIRKSDERYSMTARNVTVLEQPSLQQKHVLPSPMLEADGQQQAATCYSLHLSPNQEHLAIIWRVDSIEGTTLARSLRIYAMSNGTEVAKFDTLALLLDPDTTQLPRAQLLWSPDSSQVLIRALPAHGPEPFTDEASPVLLCGPSNSLRSFITIPNAHEQALSWSPDGQYIHFDCWGIGQFYYDPPDLSQTCGTVYHEADGQVAFEWSHPGSTVPGIWSAAGCSLCLPSCRTVVAFPSKSSQDGVVQQPWEGPDLPAEEASTFPP